MTDQFSKIAKDYDKLYSWDKRAKDEHDFFASIIKQHNIKKILDCACGTGFHIVMLSNLGVEITGSDISKSLLERAKSNLKKEKIQAKLVQSSWQKLPQKINEKFDLLLCIGNSLTLLLDDAEIEKSLKSMYAMLNENGLIVVQNRNIDQMLIKKPRTSFAEYETDNFVLYINKYYDDKISLNIFNINTEQETADINYNKFDLNLLTKNKLEKVAKKSGFNDVQFFGNYRFNKYIKSKSDSLIMIAKKS